MRLTQARLISPLLLFGVAFITGCTESPNVYRTVPAPPLATLSTSSVAFGATPLGSTSAKQSVTLTNSGTGSSLSFSGVSVAGTNPGSFLATSNCPALIASGNGCAVSVAFAPAASGNLSAILVISDDAAGQPQQVALSGTGTSTGPVVSLTSTALTFPALPIGQAATQTLGLNNIGSGNLNLSGFSLTGANASSFALSGSCLTSGVISAGNACSLTVTYAPTQTGALSATINVNDNAPGSPQTVSIVAK